MKASDVLNLYAQGRRDFRGENLRGRNFKGKDLSGADFNGCDIRGTNFNQAKAGLTFWQTASNTILLSLLGAFSQYFLFKIFKFPTFSNAISLPPTINFVLFLILLATHCWYFFWNSIRENSLIVVGGYIVFGIIATAFALVEWTTNNIETFIILGIINSELTIIFAIYTSTILAITDSVNFFIIVILTAILVIGFIEGSISSQVNQSTIIIGIIISIISLFSGYLIGWRGLQEDKKHSWVRPIALSIAATGGTSFHNAFFTDADFTSAILKNTDLRAKLIRTCFKDTVKLDFARVGKTLLSQPAIRDLLINPSSGYQKDYFKANLRSANLDGASLKETNLKQADLSEATLKGADLSYANLTEVNAVNTDFSHAYLTGTCLEGWNIDTTTKLNNIDCQYIYLLEKRNQYGH